MSDPAVALVTGANSGLGYAVSAALAGDGMQVLMLCRSAERGRAARDALRRESGNEAVHLLVCDLASQAAIRSTAAEIGERLGRLDLLVNNAGTAFRERRLSPDGIEMALAVNHLAPFLLTRLLLPRLQAASPARIVNVGTRIDSAIDFDDIQWERRRYRMLGAYGAAKLGVIHFTRELARRLDGTGVTVNCVFPGVFRSNLGKTDGAFGPGWRLVDRTIGWALPTPQRAAKSVLHLARSAEVRDVSGAYFGNCKPIRAPAQADDPQANQRLWQISEQLCGLDAGP